MKPGWERARAVADAVLYEGYLLYPYRATSAKNQSRWQFGVVGPPAASDVGIGEDDRLSAQFLVDGDSALTLVVRFLQLQHRSAERDLGGGTFEPVDELTGGTQTWVTWDEAVERELSYGPFDLNDLARPRSLRVAAVEGSDVEHVDVGRLVRSRSAVNAELTIAAERDSDLYRISVTVRNTGAEAADKDEAIATSLIGTHIIAEVVGGEFISLLEPPESAVDAVSRLEQHRCFPVLAGQPGEHDLLLISPIILYDHPEIAEQSEGALYDATEIDEILTLRIMTMTDEEKAQARATDPLAAAIIDRCDSMTPEALAQLHGILRDPHSSEMGPDPRLDALDEQMRSAGLIPDVPEGVDWWDPVADSAVRPDVDAVLVNGVRVSAGCRVLLRPSRRADAQDIFFAGRSARVISVHEDVDGQQYVGVIVEDDPDVEMPDSYGRYLYFMPDEVEPIESRVVSPDRSS
ncbi:hypothetical protein BST36_22290 [Mycolicibacterium moriokaense]|uniref:Uncharacterized protein n=1 Tax=Mycolicibacterium moriokaense TaxID=39691 RepID=A0AAD1HCY3_9MYCO|nr:hypothetical protein [Mycolicibacterium moriokaense]MCV7038058.1 hypothetical protein [Mycolicibacterium moriokaense]ORB19190.1 hypothetical protein BST36_22290 [Mycolicibacterium moriokaense]BBX03112.1 hypothetical protein MMOR_40480 [Mycolicibacterium moriokaense]